MSLATVDSKNSITPACHAVKAESCMQIASPVLLIIRGHLVLWCFLPCAAFDFIEDQARGMGSRPAYGNASEAELACACAGADVRYCLGCCSEADHGAAGG